MVANDNLIGTSSTSSCCPPAADAAAAGELMREVARLYTRAQRTVAECCQTSSTQCQLLVELGRAGPMPLAEIGQRLSLEKSWVSRAVDGLVDRGWATKEPNPADARSWLVTLSDPGRQRVQELNTTLDNHAARVLQALPAAERPRVEHALRLLLQALREHIDIAACCPVPTPSASPANHASSQDPSSCR